MLRLLRRLVLSPSCFAPMAMLVDYAASDDDEDDPVHIASPRSPAATSAAPSAAPVAVAPPPTVLPSAAELFDGSSPSASTGNSSSVPRKRPQVNGSSHPPHAPKVPRAGPNSSSVRSPATSLVPPQLRGRSNVATEDLDKLFVNRHQRKPE